MEAVPKKELGLFDSNPGDFIIIIPTKRALQVQINLGLTQIAQRQSLQQQIGTS